MKDICSFKQLQLNIYACSDDENHKLTLREGTDDRDENYVAYRMKLLIKKYFVITFYFPYNMDDFGI